MLFKNLDANDEQLLWEKFLTGDENAYACIYRKYIEELFSYGMRFTADRELVKDCIQDVFVKIYSNRSNLGSTNNIRLYLFIALKNALFNVFEKDKSVYHVDTIEPVFAADYSIEEELFADELEQEKKDRINHILSVLTPRQKEVIYYRYVKGLHLNQICEIMDMNYQSVQNLIQRSIKKIHSSFEDKREKTLALKIRTRC